MVAISAAPHNEIAIIRCGSRSFDDNNAMAILNTSPPPHSKEAYLGESGWLFFSVPEHCHTSKTAARGMRRLELTPGSAEVGFAAGR